jgi:hypothetical protein
MANVKRWVHGDRHEVKADVLSATEIEVGDLLYLDVTNAKPANAQSDQGSESANQQLFHDQFLGIALEAHPAGSGDYKIRVATKGIFEYPCIAATHELGDLIAPDEDSGGTFLQNQVVVKVSASNAAIGRVTKDTTSEATVQLEIVSSVIHGGPHTIT